MPIGNLLFLWLLGDDDETLTRCLVAEIDNSRDR